MQGTTLVQVPTLGMPKAFKITTEDRITTAPKSNLTTTKVLTPIGRVWSGH